MTVTDQRIIGLVLIVWAVLSILLVAVCYRLGARRDQADDAARRHPAGKSQRPLRIVR